MKIAVTDPGSFVGSRMIESLQLRDTPTLVAIARDPAELTTPARFALELRVADYLSVESLARGFTGCRAVVHMAHLVPAEMKRAAGAVCRAAAAAKVRRVILISSADVHGVPPPPGTNEKSPLHTLHANERTDAFVGAERQFLKECRQLGIDGYVLRPGFLYGPRSPVIANLATALTEERDAVVRHGEGLTNCLYVDNLVAAVRLTLKTKAAAGSVFLLTDSEKVTWREFYETAADELKVGSGLRDIPIVAAGAESPRGPTHAAPADAIHRITTPLVDADLMARESATYQLPLTRATKELGYAPVVTFAEGMQRSIAWWRFSRGEFFAAA